MSVLGLNNLLAPTFLVSKGEESIQISGDILFA